MGIVHTGGIAAIIDNGIGEEKAINTIISKIREKGIPTCEIKNLDDAQRFVANLPVCNFIMVDWNMFKDAETDEPGVRPGDEYKKQVHNRVIDFIKKLKDFCFAPVFLFTHESRNVIEEEIVPMLKKEELYYENGRDFILVRNKEELLANDNLFEEVEDWINTNPPIYVLMLWQREMLKAKNAVFWRLYKKSKGWPCILFDWLEEQGQDPVQGMSSIIFELIASIMSMPKVEEGRLRAKNNIDLTELKTLIRSTMFLEKVHLHGIRPGDIFVRGNSFYMNIRPECDTIKRRTDHEIYLIKGRKRSQAWLKDNRHTETSRFAEHIDEAFVYFLADNLEDVVVFDLSQLQVEKFSSFEKDRLYRLLPPYVTRMQQRFSACIGRIGIPEIPKQIRDEILGQKSSGDADLNNVAEEN